MLWGLFANLVFCFAFSLAAFYYLMREEKLAGKKQLEFKMQMEQVSLLQVQLAESQDMLKKKEQDRGALDKKLLDLETQLGKINKDSSLTLQMYEGLKAQYAELENEVERLRQDLNNKSLSLETEKALNEQLKEKYEILLRQNTDKQKL